MYYLTIPGEPVTKARPQVTKRGFAFTPNKTKNYETFVRELFYVKHGMPLMDGAIRAELAIPFTQKTSSSIGFCGITISAYV